MDPLTITTSIFGLLKATAQVAQYLAPYVAAARDTPKIVTQVHSEVVYSRTILLALDGLTKNLAAIPVKRAALIDIDQLVAVFTDGVLLFSELEASLPSLPPTEPASPRIPLQARLQWASKESAFVALLARLQSFKVSITSILTILQSDSDHRAELQQQELLKNVAALLETNQALSRRLRNLEDAFEVGTIVSKCQSRIISTAVGVNDELSKRNQLNAQNEDGNMQPLAPPEDAEVSSFDFENDLETSRPYRRAQRDTMDFSFRSSIAHTNAWSQFSGLSLSNVSIISAIALPLYPDEIENAQHYELRPEQPIPATVLVLPRSKPLYQSCLDMKEQLSQISGFQAIFASQSTDSEEQNPLTFLMQVFRQGIPLLMLLARVQGVQDISHYIQLENYKGHEQRIPKVATFKFIEACLVDLGFWWDECFTISDLYGHDSTGSVKVVKVVTRLLDNLLSSGDILSVNLAAIADAEPRRAELSSRDILVEGFLIDERTYVENLERLLEFKRIIDTGPTLQNDKLSAISNLLYPLIDTQRQFLLAIKTVARQPWQSQTWAAPFRKWSERSSLYAKYVINENGATEYIRNVLARREQYLDANLSSVLSDSLRLLYLPSQRLIRYSVFLKGLLRQVHGYEKQDVSDSILILQGVLRTLNAAIKDQELQEAHADFVARVQDWKNHRPEDFGQLLLFDDLDVVPGKSGLQKTYRAYFYERILILCKEDSPSQKLARSLIFRRRKTMDSDSASNLNLLGRIFVTNMTNVLCISKPGAYTCQVFWRGATDSDDIVMNFATESKMKAWYQAIDLQRKKLAQPVPEPTNFPWMKDHMAPIQNPYADASDDDSDESDFATPTSSSRPRLPPRFPIQDYSYPKSKADLAGPSVPLPPSMASNLSQTNVAQQEYRYSAPDIYAHNRSRPLPDDAITSQVPAIPGIIPHQHHPSRSSILIAPPRLGLRPLIKDESDENLF